MSSSAFAPIGKMSLSAVYGVGSAVIVGLIGPIWAAPVLILLFPLVFRRAANMVVEALLVAFAIGWLGVIFVETPLLANAPPDWWPLWIGFSAVPLVVAGLMLAWRRRNGLGRAGRPSDVAG